jgi:hypothetical protein
MWMELTTRPIGSHAEHYAAVRELLATWSELWGHSIFHRFTEMERLIPESWFQYGSTESLPDQFAIGQGEKHELLNHFANGFSGSEVSAIFRDLQSRRCFDLRLIED